jgi:hypothetical protein
MRVDEREIVGRAFVLSVRDTPTLLDLVETVRSHGRVNLAGQAPSRAALS